MAYYVDANGMLQIGNPLEGPDLALPQHAQGWEDTQLSFGRNSHYWGINRSYTIPLKFVGDGAKIIRSLFYGGKGIETPLTLVVLKWNDLTGTFTLYYRGQLDLSKINDQVAEGVTVNIMEGGVIQLLKSFENTIFEIPCDGSIPENVKVNADGILFTDTFHYDILKIQSPFAGDQPLPCTFVNNDGDNIGIIKGSQVLEQPYAGYYQKSSNFLFSAEEATTVKLMGNIVIKSDTSIHNTAFYMHTATSLSQPRGVGGVDHAIGLAKPFNNVATTIWHPTDSQFIVDGQVSLSFTADIHLVANENLFILFFNDFAAFPITILGGSFSMTFNSRYRPSRVWGMTAYDLFVLLIRNICALASTSAQTFTYRADSQLLRDYLNLIVTSGDAARASTNPNYFQYFNQATLNPQNPNNQFYNPKPFLGPAIKTSLSDFFDGFNPILNAALGNQVILGQNESIFFERKSYVLDSSVVTMKLKQVANLRITLDLEHFFNWLRIGYGPQSYDETSGKYEYNNTSQFQAPIKAIAKVLDLISRYRADSYGFEYTRWNTSGGKSSTFNSSDNSVFILDTDPNSFIYDFYEAKFISGIPNPSSATNTDQNLIPKQAYQAVYYDILDGEYFVTNNDYSIFIFNQPAPGTKTVATTFTALLNGLIGDAATITLYINGVITRQWSQAVTIVNTPFNITDSFSRAFIKGDNIYYTVSTVGTCTIDITAFELNVGAGYFICDGTGDTKIAAGETQQLIPLPLVTPTLVAGLPVVSYGMGYFRFLSTVSNTNFDWSAIFGGWVQGGAGTESVTFDVWLNGVIIGTVSHPGASGFAQFNPTNAIDLAGNITFNLYDLIWVTGSPTNLNSWVSYMSLKFTSGTIKALSLNRPAFSNVVGLPNPETAFNLMLTPKRMALQNGSLLRPILFNLSPGLLKFQTTDKNQFVSTTLNGVTVTENANIDIHELDDPLFLPLILEFDTEEPVGFEEIQTGAANGHIEVPYKNTSLFGFPVQVTAKPALRESQSWKLLCSPKTNILDLIDLDWDGIITLQLMDATIPIICPVHFVPVAYAKDPRYNTFTMDQDWFKNRITDWIDRNDYFAPWQTNDVISLQCQTAGLSPVTAQLLNFTGAPVGAPIDIPSVSDPAILSPQTLFQGPVLLNSLAEGKYFILWTMGTGGGTASFISEGIWVKNYWPKSQLFEYSNTRNKLAVVFTSGYRPSIRMISQINRFSPKSKSTVFVNEPQDIDLLNAIPYDTWKLEMGFDTGIPDYMIRKIDRIMLLDTVLIDGDQYTRDGEAQIEKQTYPGQPKEYLSLDIRKAKNEDGITLNTLGQLAGPQQAGYLIDSLAFGQNLGQVLINVSES